MLTEILLPDQAELRIEQINVSEGTMPVEIAITVPATLHIAISVCIPYRTWRALI